MMVDLESEKIVNDNTKDLPIEDCLKHPMLFCQLKWQDMKGRTLELSGQDRSGRNMCNIGTVDITRGHGLCYNFLFR